jgi:hypothetical protein
MNPGSSNTPLTDVVPWSVRSPRTILVGDSVESDGRFVLCTLATQVLAVTTTAAAAAADESKGKGSNSKPGRVLWLSTGPWTERLIANALKKMGCDAATTYLRTLEQQSKSQSQSQSIAAGPGGNNSDSSPLTIRSLAKDISQKIETEGDNLDIELFTKQVYRDAKQWLQKQSKASESSDEETVPWIILDDVSALGALVGERLAYGLVLSLNALATHTDTNSSFGLMLRCSQDLDQELSKDSTVMGASVEKQSIYRQPDWVGAGGQGRRYTNEEVAWERSLFEMVDGIVDVLPLASGYTREAHGKLLFTACPGGRGWGDDSKGGRTSTLSDGSTLVFNYCLTDSKVQAIQIRGTL